MQSVLSVNTHRHLFIFISTVTLAVMLQGYCALGGDAIEGKAVEHDIEPLDVHFPHLLVDVENKTIDLDATVVQREANWLELLVCSPGTREHEAILTVAAKPSHIHLALTMIGLEQGSPMMVRRLEDGELETRPAKGSRVAVSVIYEVDGKTVEHAAGRWVVNRKTGKTLEHATWLFTGSYFHEYNGQRFYMADVEGTVLSLVNFGDDLMTLPSKTTNYSDQEQYGCNTELIPALGTKLTVRLKAGEVEQPPTPAGAASTQPSQEKKLDVESDAAIPTGENRVE